MRWLWLPLLLLSQTALGQSRAPAAIYVERYSAKYGVPAELLSALIDMDSRWNPRAVSNKGALGLMQLMPATAHRFGAVQPFDPEQNIAAGTRYVTTLMWEFHGDLRLVAAAYYAGDRWIGRKQLEYRNPEVVAYVEAVRRRFEVRKFAATQLRRR